MALKSIWKGVITFGMVSIPVKLYSAIEEEKKKIELHQYHKECQSRIQLPKWCPSCDRKLAMNEIQRGYEPAKGERPILLEESDLETLPLKSRHTIEITEVIDAQQIDPILYERSFYIEAEELGNKPYLLLLQALEKTRKIAIGQLTYRGKEDLIAIRPYKGILLLHTLYYKDEVKDPEEIKPKKETISKEEGELAIKFIEALTQEKFRHEKYHNQYYQALRKLIEAKMAREVIPALPEPPKVEVMDIRVLLEASIAKIEQEKIPVKRKRRSKS